MTMNAYIRDDAFYFPVRIFYEDTDAGGVVYHSNYLKFCERARTEWLRHLNVGRERMQNEFGLMFVVRRATIDWRRPSRLDDLLMVETRILAIGKVRMTLRQTIHRDDTLIAAVDIEVVAVGVDTRPPSARGTDLKLAPVHLPQALRDLLPAAPEMEEKRPAT